MSIKILCVLLVLAVVTYGFPQGYQQQNLDPAFGRYPNQGFPQGYQQQNLDPAFGRYPNQGFQNGPGNFGQPGFGQEGFGQGGFPGQGGYGNIAGSHPGGYKEHGY
ncbi:mesenchyme-specific cell surface glycoprotein-like isoform X1 [Danaus plexippus]|uniref:mesenchyme-specific cell surface glycoprotein-like isoform X1 n=1 Tax=Danaus plexippus TaxID=13037 RepID=UPI002AB0CEFB|nr:mesenchyme-specific cell surface glycoprotein-like isoform X1 [Danaus plexippus]